MKRIVPEPAYARLTSCRAGWMPPHPTDGDPSSECFPAESVMGSRSRNILLRPRAFGPLIWINRKPRI